MNWLLFIHKILFSSTCSEPQVLIFRRIQLYTCSIWYCHSHREFLVSCRYTAWVRTDCRGKVVGGCLETPTNNQHVLRAWCFPDRASWIDYALITNLMHWLLFIHKILFFSTCFEPQVLFFRRIQLYTCSIWYCHSQREFLVACRYTAWVRTDCRGKVVGGCLKTL